MALQIGTPTATPLPATRGSRPAFSLASRVSSKDRKFFTEQLSLLLETGNSLSDSLEIIVGQSDSPALSGVINDILDQLNGGKSFSAALAEHPEIFSRTYITLIAASEDGGYMHSVLNHILDMEEKREDLISTLTSAFTYPAFLVVFALLVIIFILGFVFPKFADLFANIRDELPATTVMLMWLSDITRNYWWAILAVVIVSTGSLIVWYQSEAGKRRCNDLIAGLPLVGGLLYEIYLIQTMRIIGLSLTNGVTLVESIQACRDIVKNSQYLAFMDSLYRNVTEGRTFAAGFNETGFIPPLIRQMVKTGEESGKLALVCTRIADHYQKDLALKLKSLSKMIEPLMLLVMGVVVGLIVSSIILPIFKLSRAVH